MKQPLSYVVLVGLTLLACDKSSDEAPAPTPAAAPASAAAPAPAPAPAPATGQPCDDWISGAQAQEIVQGGGVLLDVRTPAEFSDKHLDGAVNIAVDDLEGRMTELDKEKPVVVYCQSGRRAERAAEMLKSAGYTVSEIGRMAQYDPGAPAGCHD